MKDIYAKLIEGGPFFMFPILFLLILVLVFIVKGILEKSNNPKTISLLTSIGWFTLFWGILGQTIGLIMAFDAIQAAGDISPGVLSGGLKVSLLTTVFGIFTFLVARLGIIILVWLKKEDTE